jgi:anti-sigma B factor antagonist
VDLTVQHLSFGTDGVLVLVAGELDVATLPRLRSGVAAALAAAPASTRRVVIDLDAVGLLDPVVLGVLLEARLRVHDRGATLTLRCNEPRIRRVLERTGMDQAVPVVEDVPGI